MQQKNYSSTIASQDSPLVIVKTQNQANLEFEIESHVNSIRALIKRLRPTDRQRYYDGLLSHLLSQPVSYPEKTPENKEGFDYCNLSVNELSLIRELSVKIHELYLTTEEE